MIIRPEVRQKVMQLLAETLVTCRDDFKNLDDIKFRCKQIHLKYYHGLDQPYCTQFHGLGILRHGSKVLVPMAMAVRVVSADDVVMFVLVYASTNFDALHILTLTSASSHNHSINRASCPLRCSHSLPITLGQQYGASLACRSYGVVRGPADP